jgi:large subunit ribosomal protein L24
MQRVQKGDTVEVIAGKDLGVRGPVLQVLPKTNRVLVKDVNIVSKHEKARQRGAQQIQAQIVTTEAPIDLSNVMPVCPSCDKATRVGHRVTEGGKKVRVCKACGADLDTEK